MCIRRDVLLCSARRFCRLARAKDRDRTVAIRPLSAAADSYVAEDLIVRPVFADDVDDMFEWRCSTGEDIAFFAPKQAVVSHRGLGIGEQILFGWDIDHTDIPRNDRDAVFAAFIVGVSGVIFIRHIGIRAAVVYLV